MIDGYYNRFDPAKNYDEHLFRAGYVLQSAELNEIQSAGLHRLKRFGDALFKDGGILQNAQLVVDSATGAAIGEAGILYLQGQLRGIPRREFTVPVQGEITVGVYLVEQIITEMEDPALRDPAIGVRNYQEAGAARLQREPRWGYAGESGAPTADFFPVYTVIDGVVVPREPPPNIDAVTQAIARYDRQSAGGYYAVNGLRVTALADDATTGEQQYSIQEGSARVNGQEVNLPTAVRARFNAAPDLGSVVAEPTLADNTSNQRITCDFSPVASFDQIIITTEKTATLVHGGYSGAQDELPDPSVLSLQSVTQGATTFVVGVDCVLTGNRVDWSATGKPEPNPNTTYQVTYRYQASAAPVSPDETGCTVQGAVPGTLIQVSYSWKKPRIDRLCLTAQGLPMFVQGLAHNYNPLPPAAPDGVLPLALIKQTWTTARSVTNDAVRVVPMAELESMNQRIEDLYSLVADQRLLTNALGSDPSSKKGIFVDPFLDDDMRDQGIDQTAAIINGELTLGIVSTAVQTRPSGMPGIITLTEAAPAALLQQTLQTGSMKVNPYDAFTPLPAIAELNPALDFWTGKETRWLSPATLNLSENQVNYQVLSAGWTQALRAQGRSAADISQFIKNHTLVMTTEQVTVTQRRQDAYIGEAQYLRSISVEFTLEGFGPNEALNTVKFDGASVAFTA